MADGFVTVLWWSHREDSEPIGVFESNRRAAEYIRKTYGDCQGLEYITEEDGEFYFTPTSWEDGQLVVQRFELNTAKVINPRDP